MPVTKQGNTFWAEIYCGLTPGYDEATNETLVGQRVLADTVCREFCDDHEIGVTVTNMTFIYPGGKEPGVIVGLFDYPRFPTGWPKVLASAKELADVLLVSLKQERLSIVCADQSYLVERETEPEVPDDPTMIMNTAEIADKAEQLEIQHAPTMEMPAAEMPAIESGVKPALDALKRSEDATTKALASLLESENYLVAAAEFLGASGVKGVTGLVMRLKAASRAVRNEHDDTIQAFSNWGGSRG